MHTASHPSNLPPPSPPQPILTGLGQALRWLRERQARKQYQVAGDAGITKGMLSAYETGRQRPSLETLDKLLDTLGCDLNDLHNALQIVNGRPEQMKGWAAESPSYAAMHNPSVLAASPLARHGFPPVDEIHEPARGGATSELRQLLGDGRSPLPVLPPEEELALAQMLEGFHSLLRYWHRCLASLAGRGPLDPPDPAEAPAAAATPPADPDPAPAPPPAPDPRRTAERGKARQQA